MGEGRFGLVYRAEDSDGRIVVVRTFARALEPEQSAVILEALEWLCATPLEHPSIARPIASGMHEDHPYLVHTYLEGTPLDQLLASHGPQPLPDVALRVTQLAAAIDFAAAVGVHHGVLGPHDVILASDSAGVTGFGLVQAMAIASMSVAGRSPYGSPQRCAGESPTQADDVYSLASIAYELLHGRAYAESAVDSRLLVDADRIDSLALRAAFAAGLASSREDRPATALAFAAALQSAVVQHPVTAAAAPTASEDPLLDFAIHDEKPQPPVVAWEPEPPPRAEPVLHKPAPAPPQSSSVLGLTQSAPPSGGVRVSSSRRERLAAAVLISLAIGFAIGFAAGRGGDSLLQTFSPTGAPATAPLPDSSTEQPRPTSGEVATEVEVPAADPPANDAAQDAVPQTPVTEVPSPPEVVDPPRPRPTAPPSRSAATAGDARGALQVLSRPEGAEVFLDGALVGRTPLSIADVRAGDHVVRLEMTGYRRWVASVQVLSGDSTRVAASLEQ